MAKRKTTLKKKVSKRQTRKFSKKGGSKKGGSKKGGSKKGGSKKKLVGGKQADREELNRRYREIAERKEDAKKYGIKTEMIDEMTYLEANILKDRKNFEARFNSKGIMHTPIDNNNINQLIRYAKEKGKPKSLDLLLQKGTEKGLNISEDDQSPPTDEDVNMNELSEDP